MKPISRRTFLQWMTSAAAVTAIPTFCLRSRPLFASQVDLIPSEQEQADIASIARELMSQNNIPGFSVAIAKNGQFAYLGGFGFADVSRSEQMTSSHRFRIASLSKPTTSAAIFSLIENGRLDLNNTVFGPNGILGRDYPQNLPAPVQAITIQHLLTHTCGGWEKGKDDPMFHNYRMDHKELIAWTLRSQPLDHMPGEHYAYSNFGYCLLGRVVEKITGQPYADMVQQTILARCSIGNMQIGGNTVAEKAPDEVTYYGQNGENPYGMNVRRMDSHGGWIGTPADMVQFAMHVGGSSVVPNILSANTIDVMTTPSQANPHYACGWMVNRARNCWHSGSMPGTSTILVRTHSGLCWAGFANTRAKGIDDALDNVMWKIARAVPAWHA